MSDQAHDYADRKIAEFQAEVWETYQQAQADAQEALSAFLKRFEKEDEKRRKLVEKGEMTKAEYRSWRSGQILRSRQLSSTLDQVSQAMTEANQVAMAALAGKLPEVYAENANYSAFWVCKETGLAVGFDLVDPDTVQHMLTAGEAVLMLPSVNVAKDMAWNRKLVASQLTQGVLLGESIPKMARRVQRVTGSNYATAVRTARTTVTGAENAGRVHSYKRAKEMGIKLEKEWVATLDGRTRHSHRQLHGQKISNEEGAKFDNGCRYPGDPQGRYDEICNCRCTLVAAIEGVDTSDAERWSRLPEGMTYEEWKAGYPERPPYDSGGRTMGEFFAQPSVKAQLEKRGMTEAQARKALSEHLKAQGTNGNAFRSMQKAEQQALWKKTLSESGMGPLGGTIPAGLSGTELTRDMAKGMADILRETGEEGIKAVFRKYGKSLRAVDEGWHAAWFNDSRNRVEMDLSRAMNGSSEKTPYQTVFHEFGHMVDWLAGGRRGFASASSGIVKAIDADWRKLQIKALVEEELGYSREDPRYVVSNVRYYAKQAGDSEALAAARNARRAYKIEGKSTEELLKDPQFMRALERMIDSNLGDGKGFDAKRANKRILDQLKRDGAGDDYKKYGDVLDIIQGATGITRPLGFGHRDGYFDGEEGRISRATEFFAEVCSAKVANKASLEAIEEFFPGAVEEFEKLVRSM